MNDNIVNKYFYITLCSLAILIPTLFGYMFLSEWYNVEILNKITGYSFGSEGQPYFFKTAEMYSTVMLIFGCMYLTIILITTWIIFKQSKKRLLFSIFATVLLIVISFLQQYIKLN